MRRMEIMDAAGGVGFEFFSSNPLGAYQLVEEALSHTAYSVSTCFNFVDFLVEMSIKASRDFNTCS